MILVLRVLLLAIALTSAYPALASREGVLTLNSFHLSSPGIGQSGPVVVSGEQNYDRILSLTVQAFGHNVSLSKEQLAKLKGGSINGIHLSYEAGYQELGGRTVYVLLSKGFTSGSREQQLVSVNERGVVEVKYVFAK